MRHEAWGRVFKKWREHEGAARKYPASEYAVYGTGSNEAYELPRLRGIKWGMLESASGKLSELASNREAWEGHLSSLDKQLDQAWQGKAADAAREQYLAVKKPLNEYCDILERTSRALDTAVRVPREEIGPGGLSDFKDKSRFFQHYGNDDQSEDILQDIAGMEKVINEGYSISLSALVNSEKTPFDQLAERKVREKMGEGDSSYDDKTISLTWEDLRLSGAPACRGTFWSQTPSNERIKWLDTFCGWYAHDVKQLRKQIHEAYTNTESAFTELKKQLDKLDGETLTNLDDSDSGATEKSRNEGGQDRQDTRGTGSGPGSDSRTDGSGGVGNGSGSGGTAGTAGAPGGSGATERGGVSPGDVPRSGAGAGTDAGADSEQGMEQQGPGVSSGSANSGDALSRDEVTFGEGTDRITVREPSPEGNAQVTLLDEQGRERTYEIAFDDSQEERPTSEAGTVRETTSGGGGEGMRAGTPLTPGGAEAPTPDESEGQRTMPGQSRETIGDQPGGSVPDAVEEVTTIRPNEDGTAVIEQGDRTIEVERTPDGQLQLSVDDGGDQPPETRTVDFGQDSGSAEAPGSASANAAAEQPAASGQNAQQANGTTAQPSGDGAQRAAASAASGAGGAAGPAVDAASGMPSSAGETGGGETYAQPTSAPSDGGVQATPNGSQSADPLDTPAQTTSQWAGDNMFTESQSDSGPRRTFTAFSGDLFSSPEDSGGSVWGERPNNKVGEVSGSAGLPGMEDGSSRTESQGSTGLASMGESGGSGQNDQGSGRGGMMPMGGMGGGAGQQGGDEERSNDSPWRTEGNLFDDGIDTSANWKYSAVLGDQEGK
ncbi:MULTISPECIES: WXG100 family type VII secretion target [unclassified Actinopolyspora]|uniref:WXG100 family type VII secretion target n=1 Tax=Actinopolyspora TaxID=1849 RepID=UPI0013F5B07A|nr:MULTISPECIES: WXG100 family type VII secretion target [unclassified Actinopolyspora]NHD16645.1 WXG100 family type VII secretion target [Actinopolyspora sp. BKK2]NHE75492.1 WXG100 family type VII secretion target [Actinopolyspora sp. BKK1]